MWKVINQIAISKYTSLLTYLFHVRKKYNLVLIQKKLSIGKMKAKKARRANHYNYHRHFLCCWIHYIVCCLLYFLWVNGASEMWWVSKFLETNKRLKKGKWIWAESVLILVHLKTAKVERKRIIYIFWLIIDLPHSPRCGLAVVRKGEINLSEHIKKNLHNLTSN